MKHEDELLQDPHFSSLLPEITWTRRSFVVSSLATGFALAVQPVSAQISTTDTQGIVAGEVRIPAKDGDMPGYRAMPATGRDFPLMLVVQEIFGVHEHIKDVCRRFAKLGYVAVSPELYARQGDVSRLTDFKDIIAVVAKVADSQVMGDLDAAAAWARNNGGHATRLGITGFCWSGRIVWLYCAHNPQVGAGVAWYGSLVGTPNDMKPTNPIDIAATLKVPVLGLYGGADRGITMETVEQMRAALKGAGSPSEIIVYPDAPHGFHADYRPSYRKEAAEDGWKRMQAWFRKYRVA